MSKPLTIRALKGIRLSRCCGRALLKSLADIVCILLHYLLSLQFADCFLIIITDNTHSICIEL